MKWFPAVPLMFLSAALTPMLSAQTRQYIAVVDVSASRNPEVLAEDRTFLKKVAAGLTWGDAFVLQQVQIEGLQGSGHHATIQIPPASDPGNPSTRDRNALTASQSTVGAVLPKYFTAPAGGVLHTDLFATFQIAAEYLRDSGGRPVTLIVFSDMLQSARGIEMEKGTHMPSSTWISAARKQGLIPALGGACVVVIGADTTTPLGQRVKTFWQEYFRAAGAELSPSNYRITAPDSPKGMCR